ncbi:hypothetical protein JCM6882_003392 [Rhodosporidiobolus microsporus]
MVLHWSEEYTARWATELVRMLIFAICVDSILFGMTVRLAVTYARTFTRDPILYRVLVSLSAICAYLFNFISMAVIDVSGEKGLQTDTYITGRTFTAAAMCVSEAFFIVRIFGVTRNIFTRAISIILWLSSTGVLVWWSVERTRNQRLRPTIGERLGWAGIATECCLFITSSFIASVLLYKLPRVRPPEEAPKNRRQKFLYWSTVFIESSGLLAFDHLISTVTRFLSLRYPGATITTNAFYYFFPSLAVFSVAFAINQRPPPPLPPPTQTGSCSGKHGGGTSFNPPAMGGGEEFDEQPALREYQLQQQQRSLGLGAGSVAGEMARSSSTAPPAFGLSSLGGGSIIYDPDDPQTWRGDAQRFYPSIVRFDEDVELGAGGGGAGGEDFPLTRMASRPGTVKSSATSERSWRTNGGRPGFGAAGGASHDGAGGGGRSFVSFGAGTGLGSVGRVEYDEELVDLEPTVLSLDLGALEAAAPSSWGPRARLKEEEEDALKDPDTPTTGSTSSTPDPSV